MKMVKLKISIDIPNDIWENEFFEEIDQRVDELSLSLRDIDERIVLVLEYDHSD